MVEDFLSVTIWRGAGRQVPVSYRVPCRPNQTVLDVVTWVQRNLEPDLAYRFSCRVGMCGSCAMMVNGAPRWSCRTLAGAVAPDGSLEIGPLRNFPLIKDLVVDMDGFFEKWSAATDGGFHGSAEPAALAVVPPDEPRRREATIAVECIGCGVCHAACDTVSANPAFLGPSALNRAWMAVNDRRDPGRAAHLDAALAGDGGAHQCHSQQGCTRFCPVGLTPGRSVAGLKRAALRREP